MLRTAVRTEFGRREEAIHPQDFATRPTCFVFDKVDELIPTGVRNGFGKIVVFHHAADVETFKSNSLEAINDGSAQFMVKVLPLVGDLLMDGSDNQLGFATAVAALDLARKPPLANLQTAFAGVEVFGLFDLLASAKRSESGQAQVNTDSGARWARFLFSGVIFNFALDGDEVFACLGFRHGNVFHLPFNFAMENDPHPADFRQIDTTTFHLEALRIADGLLVKLALKGGIAGASLKKVFVRFIQVHQGLLDDLTVSLFQPGMIDLQPFGQVVSAIIVGQARCGFLIVFFSHMAVMIVDKATTTELAIQFVPLFTIRVNPKLKGFLDHCSALAERALTLVRQDDARAIRCFHPSRRGASARFESSLSIFVCLSIVLSCDNFITNQIVLQIHETTAKIELAWRDGRAVHVIRYNTDKNAVGLPYLIAHEFEHALLAQEARAAQRNLHFATDQNTERVIYAILDKDIRNLHKRRDLSPQMIDEVIQRLVRGLCNQLYNAPLDMIIDSRVHEKYPFLHDSEFTWLADEHERNLAVLTDTAIRSIAPKKIYQANVTMNAAVVLFVDDLFNGATDLAAHYRATGLLSTGQRLYALWQEAMKNFQPGDEYLLVDAFARELKLTDTDDLSPGYASSTRPVGDEGGPTNPRLLNDPTLQMAATMYMVSAMKRFAQMSDAQVYQVVGEIALVGYTGLDYASNEPKYTLRFLPGESFSGLQMMCLMYVGFKRVQPGVDSGIPLDDAYEHALSLYEADKD